MSPCHAVNSPWTAGVPPPPPDTPDEDLYFRHSCEESLLSCLQISLLLGNFGYESVFVKSLVTTELLQLVSPFRQKNRICHGPLPDVSID